MFEPSHRTINRYPTAAKNRMGKCCSNLCFTILTLLTIGVTLGVFIVCILWCYKYGVTKIEEANIILIISVIGLCVSALIFFFGVYASFCGKKCAKSILAIIYLIYALGLCALAILIFAFKTQTLETFKKFLERKPDELVIQLENLLKCCGYDDDYNKTWCETEASIEVKDVRCKPIIESNYKYAQYAAGVLIGLFILLMVGDVIAFRLICRKENDEERKNQNREQLSTPLTYGW